MYRSFTSASLAAALVGAAVLGGGVALGGAALFGGLGRTTTVHEVIPGAAPNSPVAFANSGKRLTINQVYRQSAPGVVQVTSTKVVRTPQDPFFGNPFNLPDQQTEQALGSGFVISKAGYIITNYHVVAGASKVRVSFSDGEDLAARVVGKDPSTDIAVLKVDAKSRALKPLPLGNSDALQVGDAVVAIGNPLGYTRSITSGIVSALGRPIYAPNGFQIDHVIQTDAALNHGNSGGPLLNAQGQVVGVNSQIASSNGSDANIGIGFAIPINTVRDVVAQLIQSGKAEHAFIGIGAQPLTPDVARLFHLPVDHGLLVQSVCGDSGAAAAGIKPGRTKVTVAGETWTVGGDIITKVDGVAIGSIDRLRDLVQRKRPGDSITIELYRGTGKVTKTVKLGQQPTSAKTC